MKINYLDNNPREIQLEEDLPPYMSEGVADDIAEIFSTPLSGAYNWDYTIQDNRIKKLYELGKELNWNGSSDLDWDYNHPKDEPLTGIEGVTLPQEELDAWKNLTDEEKI